MKPVDADGDGAPDDHPILGSAGIPWTTPIFLLERGRTAAEVAAGVPRVLLIGSTRPSQTAFKQVFSPSIDMLIPPVAVVDLNPAYRSCRIPYVPPGNLASMYEGLPAECQEVPSGWYAMSVLQGVAGGTVTDGAEAAFSDTGYLLEGGSFSGQAWSIPNELGPPDPIFGPVSVAQLDAGFLRPSQGERFRVFDGKPVDGVRHDCESALDASTGTMRPVSPTPVPDRCCEPVRHLCGLPLCAAGAQSGVREVTTSRDGALTCVPFEMPASCCNGGG